MALRKLRGCLSVAALAACLWTGCKDKAGSTGTGSTDLDKRCEQLAKACGDNDKHVEKIVTECKQAGPKQVEKGCTDKANAAYDCYQKQLCGTGEKVWALDDYSVLADRHTKCVAERNALRDCMK